MAKPINQSSRPTPQLRLKQRVVCVCCILVPIRGCAHGPFNTHPQKHCLQHLQHTIKAAVHRDSRFAITSQQLRHRCFRTRTPFHSHMPQPSAVIAALAALCLGLQVEMASGAAATQCFMPDGRPTAGEDPVRVGFVRDTGRPQRAQHRTTGRFDCPGCVPNKPCCPGDLAGFNPTAFCCPPQTEYCGVGEQGLPLCTFCFCVFLCRCSFCPPPRCGVA